MFSRHISVSDIEFREIRWRVLIADDSAAASRALRTAIDGFFVKSDIVEVTSGRACLEELATNSYDMAFVDLVFQDLSGLEVLNLARAAGSRTFVTVVSDHRTPEAVDMAKALRAYDVLPKPFRSEDVTRVLDIYAQASQRRKVLVVDDSGTARQIMTKIIGRSLFRLNVIEASDVVSGFEAFVRERPEVVLIDVDKAEIGGRSADRIFRAHRPDAAVVLVSADAETLATSGARFTLNKPFDSVDIDGLLHRALGLKLPYTALDLDQPRHDVRVTVSEPVRQALRAS